MSELSSNWVSRALLLAAGASNRFGADKRDALISKDQTLLRATLGSYLRVLPDVTVCLSSDSRDDRLCAELTSVNVTVLRCEGAAGGMGETLAEASRKNTDVDILLVALADMPLIRGFTIRSVLQAARPDRIVLPLHNGRRGHPVAFGQKFFEDLHRLSGDRGAASVIRHNPRSIIEIRTDDAGIHADADTPEALALLRHQLPDDGATDALP